MPRGSRCTWGGRVIKVVRKKETTVGIEPGYTHLQSNSSTTELKMLGILGSWWATLRIQCTAPCRSPGCQAGWACLPWGGSKLILQQDQVDPPPDRE